MNLSVSQLNLYKNCPLAYKFRYIDKLPEPKIEAFEFGTKFHESIPMGFSADKEINVMIEKIIQEINISHYEYEKKEYVNLDGFNFVYVLDGVNDNEILEFKSSKYLWQNNRFNEEWQAQLYLKAEYEKTGKWKTFRYLVVTKDKYPKIQNQIVKFNSKIYNQIINTAKQLCNDWEYKPLQYKIDKSKCSFCNFKNNCHAWF